MHRENFTEGSVSQIIFDIWDHPDWTDEQAEKKLMRKPKKELVDFILTAQSKGRFGNGYIHK
jgi:hypothetical protein